MTLPPSDIPETDDLVYALGAAPDFDFKGRGTAFAGRASGLYRSVDGGKTWKFAYASLGLKESLPTLAVAAAGDLQSDGGAESQPGAGSKLEVFAGVPGGVLHSSDGGEHWDVIRFGSPPPVVSALALSPHFAQDGVVLAGTVEDGVFRSADGGSRWTPWNFGLLDLNVICLAISPHFKEDETLLAGTDSGLFRSTNGGRAWREVNLPVEYDPVLSLAFAPKDDGGRLAWAGTESRGLLVSSDGGESWSRLAEAEIPGPVNAILVSPQPAGSPELLVLQGDGPLVSSDGGRSWSKWRDDPALEAGVAAVLAPGGFGAGAPALVGLADGRIVTLA